MAADSFNLQRFVDAQEPVWQEVRAELAAAHKRTHWMWFVFPQLAALGRSGTAKFYGLGGAGEARAYLAHPLLGARLRECCELLLKAKAASAEEIFGGIDTVKLKSCLTLFDALAGGNETLFADCLDRFFAGERAPMTLQLLGG